MKAAFKRVVESIITAEIEPGFCEPHRPFISDYVETELDGQDAESLFPELAEHLEICPDCYEEYEDLRQTLDLERQGRLKKPPRPAQFDFSFLKEIQPEPQPRDSTEAPPKGPTKPFWWDEPGRLIIQFSAELVGTWQPPAPQLAYAPVKSDKSSRILCQLPLKEVGNDLEVEITAEEMRDDPTLCTVIVEVNIPSRGGWPNLAGTEVMLKRGELEMEAQLTDAFGEVAFEGIRIGDLAHLVFEITPTRET